MSENVCGSSIINLGHLEITGSLQNHEGCWNNPCHRLHICLPALGAFRIALNLDSPCSVILSKIACCVVTSYSALPENPHVIKFFCACEWCWRTNIHPASLRVDLYSVFASSVLILIRWKVLSFLCVIHASSTWDFHEKAEYCETWLKQSEETVIPEGIIVRGSIKSLCFWVSLRPFAVVMRLAKPHFYVGL